MSNIDNFKIFPVIDCGDYVLRELNISDAPAFYHYLNHQKVAQYLAPDDVPKSLTQAKIEIKYWRSLFYSKISIFWAIARKSNNQLIGTCGFNHINNINKRAEISYDLDYHFWRRGIMSKTLYNISMYGIEYFKLNRIQATVVIDNEASIKLLEKLGFVREAMLKDYAVINNQKTNSYLYALTDEL